MDDLISLRMVKGIALIHIAAPPVNALDHALRQRLWRAFERAEAEQELRAVILLANGRVFTTGAEPDDDAAALEPTLSDLCIRIENCRVPVIAALQGAALGGGAALALAAHYRIALPAVVIGLPEVTLGLVPGAGATQRLPRIAGAAAALEMILGGKPVDAARAADIGLIDKIVQDDLAVEAMLLAREVQEPRPSAGRDEHLQDPVRFLAQVTAHRRADRTGLLAAGRAIECIEAAALLPFDEGLALEADSVARCLAHPQSWALRHLFAAERRIGPAFLLRRPGGRRIAEPDGKAVVAALRQAWKQALLALQASGLTRDLMDRAHVDAGFARGPFGGTQGGAGASGDDIARRVLAALAAEGARLIAAGTVPRASDIDVLAVRGLGYPRFSGGPMYAAQIAGLSSLGEEMKRWSADDPVWQPPALLLRAALLPGGIDAAVAEAGAAP